LNSSRSIMSGFVIAGCAAVVVACSTSSPASSSFDVAVVVVGNGVIASDGAEVDCAGPKDCGRRTVTGPEITLTASPAQGYVLREWERDGVAVGGLEDPRRYRVQSTPGATTKIRATFVATAGGGAGAADSGGGSAGEGGAPDGGEQKADAGSRVFTCGRAPCASGEVCCASSGVGGTILCRAASCLEPAETVATCAAPGDCGSGEVCCLRNKNDGSPSTMACAPAAACPVSSSGYTGPLCDATHPCAAGSCNAFNRGLSFCSNGR